MFPVVTMFIWFPPGNVGLVGGVGKGVWMLYCQLGVTVTFGGIGAGKL